MIKISNLWDISIEISILIIVVFLIRVIFYCIKVPKKYTYILWIIVFLRLMIPWSFQSSIVLFPQNSYSMTEMVNNESINVLKGTNENHIIVQNMKNKKKNETLLNKKFKNNFIIFNKIMTGIWMTGVILLLLYILTSYIKLKYKLRVRIHYKDNIYLTDYADAPFVFGIFNPIIYLPSTIQKCEVEYVILHEKIHIKRKDPVIKFMAFFITCIYWFHPLVWAAYIYMGRDMEMSCDEAVIRKYNQDIRKDYATVLLSLSGGIKQFSGFPLAFGEENTKERIKHIIKYKKAMSIVVIAAIAVIIIVTSFAFVRYDNKNMSKNAAAKKENEINLTSDYLLKNKTENISRDEESEIYAWLRNGINNSMPDPILKELDKNGNYKIIDQTVCIGNNEEDPTLRLDFTFQNGILVQYVSKEYGFADDLEEDRISEEKAEKLVEAFAKYFLNKNVVLKKEEVYAGYDTKDYIAYKDEDGDTYLVQINHNMIIKYDAVENNI